MGNGYALWAAGTSRMAARAARQLRLEGLTIRNPFLREGKKDICAKALPHGRASDRRRARQQAGFSIVRRSLRYCEISKLVEPVRLISVTLPGITALTSPVMVKGCVRMKTLPNWLLLASWNQVPNTLFTSTVMDEAEDCNVCPEAALKLNTA